MKIISVTWWLTGVLLGWKGKAPAFLSSSNRHKRQIKEPAHACQSKTGDITSSQCPLSCHWSVPSQTVWTWEWGCGESMWVKSILCQLPLVIMKLHAEGVRTRVLQKACFVAVLRSVDIQEVNEEQKVLCSYLLINFPYIQCELCKHWCKFFSCFLC